MNAKLTITLAAILAVNLGCSTMMSRANMADSQDMRFSGTRTNLENIGSDSVDSITILMLLDLPFSLAADAALLPLDAVKKTGGKQED